MSQVYLGKDLEAMSFAPNYHQWILKEFMPYLGTQVAEVGAGTGNFSQLLLQTGVLQKLVALEPSGNMFEKLQEGLKSAVQSEQVEAKQAFFGDCNYDGCFDTVFYINVLEHIQNDAQELHYVKQSLKPGGHLCLFVPALSYLYSELDKQVGHVRRYHKNPLKELVIQAGFKLINIKYFDILGILPWYIAFVLLKQTTNSTNVSLYDKLAVPVMSRIEPRLIPPIGKNLLVVAQKPL